jgi:hypothetical protein
MGIGFIYARARAQWRSGWVGAAAALGARGGGLERGRGDLKQPRGRAGETVAGRGRRRAGRDGTGEMMGESRKRAQRFVSWLG